jgi:preprotein translocase subunit SecF
MADKALSQKPGPIDVVKHRWIYIGLSLLFLVPGIYFIIMSVINYPTHSPVRVGIDFTGGTMLEYGFQKKLTQQDLPAIRHVFEERGYTGPVVQIQEPREGMNASGKGSQQTPTVVPNTTEQSVTASIPVATVVSIRTKQLKDPDGIAIRNSLQQQFGSLVILQQNTIGPTMATELLTNGLLALLLAYVLIVGYLTFRFQFDYAICAIVALVHDTLFVFGIFSMLGYLYHTEVDSLFITGIMTVIGFSVHDTIVVFDRLRENSRVMFTQKVPFNTIANISVNQTLARSINTSLTALLTLLALFFFGGETTREFVLCMLLGIAVGTYSSIFVASAMLAWWRERQQGSSPVVATA